jgi:Protein of unknown function (DUF3800)
MTKFNFYCDESCHLDNDNSLGGINKTIMVLGGVEVPFLKKDEIFARIREIKIKHGIKPTQELKWTKLSPASVALYLDIIDYFFDNNDFVFRGLVVKNRDKLDHTKFNQSSNEWYYKMYWQLLSIIDPRYKYNIFLDIKDSNGGERIKKLHEILCNSLYDFDKSIIKQVQLVRSHEVEIMQITDILIGALSYVNRDLTTSEAKLKVIERIKERSKYSLQKSTLKGEQKFNLFFWRPQNIGNYDS